MLGAPVVSGVDSLLAIIGRVQGLIICDVGSWWCPITFCRNRLRDAVKLYLFKKRGAVETQRSKDIGVSMREGLRDEDTIAVQLEYIYAL